MGIIFKKNGRPTKAEKGTLKNINNFLSSLDEWEREKYSFDNETVTDGNRLTDIWDNLIAPKRINEKRNFQEKSTVIDDAHGEVDTSTGEILEETEKVEQEESNFVNNEEKMEDVEFEELTEGKSTPNMDGAVDEVPSFFNPLKDPLKQRSYQKTGQVDVGEIEEPDFGDTQSAEEKLEEIEEETAYNEEQHKFHEEEEEEEEEKEWNNVRNEGMEELDDKDKKLAAKQLVQTVLDGYEMAHELAKNFVKYPEEKLQEKAIKGEIDPTMEIPIDENGTTTNPIEFFQNFNEQAEEAIAYDPEFGEKVRPAMERVFAKKGWGMTDEQFLMVAFGKDIAWKGVQIMSLKKTAKGIMATFEQLQKDKNQAIRQAKREEARSRPLEADSITTPPRQTVQPQSETEDYADSESRGYYTKSDNNQEDNQSTDIVPIH